MCLTARKGMITEMIKNKIPILCAVVLTAVFGVIYNAGNDDFGEKTASVVKETADKAQEMNFDVSKNDYSSFSGNHIGWGFKKNKGAPPDIDKKTVDLFASTNTYYMDNSGGKVMYLTFDEGYENGCSASILDTLKEKSVPAAFFITGHYLKSERELVGRMVNEGHIVGNHTVNHPNLAKSDLQTVISELKTLDDEFFALFGSHMTYMRPPEGEYSERLLNIASDMGYKTIFWSFAYRDWERDNIKGGDYAFSQVVPYFHDGAIILLHAVSKDNDEALGRIIDEARRQGYEFKSLDELK